LTHTAADIAGDAAKRQAKYEMMTTSPVNRLILKMSVPTIISMMVTAIYNMADAYFVGHLSTAATAGVGVAFAYQCFIQAVGFFFGAGSGNYISRALGARKDDDAESMAITGFLTAFIIGLAVAVAGLAFLSPLSRMLGATSQILPYADSYLKYILIATPFMITQMVLNNQLRLQGNAILGMIGLVIGAVLNIILDPVFMYTLGLDVAGASLATLVSQICSWLILVYCTTRKGCVHLRLKKFRPTIQNYREIVNGGLPSLSRQLLGALATVCLNHAAVHYAVPGYEASTVAAFAIVSRIMTCAMSAVLGFGQGFQPVCGYNWGARKYRRVKDAYLFTVKTCTAGIIVMATAGILFASQIISFFRSEDPELISIGTTVLRWQCAAFPLVGLTTPTNMLLQNIRRTCMATVLAMGRQGIFFYPAIIIAPRIWGLSGLQATLAIADICTFMLALPFALKILRELDVRQAAVSGQI